MIEDYTAEEILQRKYYPGEETTQQMKYYPRGETLPR